MPLRLVDRTKPLPWGGFFVATISLAAALAVCALLLTWQGKPGLHGVWLLVDGGFLHGYALEDAVRKAIPIFLCSLGVALCFRMKLWNIGAEGQFALGAVGATAVALRFGHWPAWAVLPCMCLAGAAAGALWALGPALLKRRLGVNEIITTLMANYIGVLVLQYLVYGAWKDPVSFGFPMTELFSDAAQVGLLPGSRIHYGLLYCVAAGLGFWWWISRTRLGFELVVSGENSRAARFAHMPYGMLICLAMGGCGALAGVAGFLEASASVHRLQPSIMVGYGFTAVVVAWLGRLRVPAIAAFSFLLAGFRVGVENLQIELQAPAAMAGVLEGTILMAVLSGQLLNHRRLVWISRRTTP
ncbi:MAG: ABC transporter permease [Desulfovibrio sp.]|nr:ABC transporter permease [Desulfovibrio sp.]